LPPITHHAIDDDEPQMNLVLTWPKKSPLRNGGWYDLACSLISYHEANALEANYTGGGSNKCLEKVIRKWIDSNHPQYCTWEVIIAALEKMDEIQVVDEITKTQTI